jgi:hypothetical protein
LFIGNSLELVSFFFWNALACLCDPFAPVLRSIEEATAALTFSGFRLAMSLDSKMLNSNLCRAQANECLLLVIEKPDDATTLAGLAAGWQTLADQIDRYHARRPHSDPALGIP